MADLQTILDTIGEVLTIQNFTFILSLFGSIGTAINVINSRKNLKLKLLYFSSDSVRKLALAYIQFENKSLSSILVTDVSLIINGVSLPCEKLPVVSQTTFRKIGKESFYHEIYNIQFPIQIAGLGGTSGYLVFDIPEYNKEYFRCPITLQVATNRGRSKKYLLHPDREYF